MRRPFCMQSRNASTPAYAVEASRQPQDSQKPLAQQVLLLLNDQLQSSLNIGSQHLKRL
jgi:hypothetical protein